MQGNSKIPAAQCQLAALDLPEPAAKAAQHDSKEAPASPDANNNCQIDSSASDGRAEATQDAAAMDKMLMALSCVNGAEITELKRLKNPPAGARLVLDAVCVLMGAKPTRVQQDPSHPSGKFVDSYAAPIKKMLALPWSDILSSILNFDKDHIAPSTLKKVQAYTSQPEMQPEKIKKTCRAAYGLCCWVHAMEAYAKAVKAPAAC